MIRPTLNRWVYNLAIGVIRLQRYTFTWSHHNCTVTILQLSNSGVSLGSKLKFKGIDGRAPPARLAGFHYRGTKHHQVCSMDLGSWQNAIYSVIHDVVSWKQGVFRCLINICHSWREMDQKSLDCKRQSVWKYVHRCNSLRWTQWYDSFWRKGDGELNLWSFDTFSPYDFSQCWLDVNLSSSTMSDCVQTGYICVTFYAESNGAICFGVQSMVETSSVVPLRQFL